jgi:DNA-binding transcriptional regulator YiaG
MNSKEKTPKKKSDIKYMKSEKNIENFYKYLNDKTGYNTYRYIRVNMRNGTKIPLGEFNNLTIEEIQTNKITYEATNKKGNTYKIENHNCLSLYVKHIPDLYVIDFDTKKDLDNCKLKNLLDEKKTIYTETTKGFHYYIYIKNMIEYTQQQKIYIDDSFEIDLIKTNNIWEDRKRVVNGNFEDVTIFEWDDIKEYFNVNKMNSNEKPSKDLSPKKTKPLNIELKEEEKKEEEKKQEEKVIEKPKKQYPINIDEIRKMVDILDINRAEVEGEWFKVGVALKNNGNTTKEEEEKLFRIFDDFSKKCPPKYDMFQTMKKWEGFKQKPDGPALSLGSIYAWAKKDNKEEYYKIKNYERPYQEIYDSEGYDGIVKQINKSVAYIKSSSEYIIETYEGWYIKKRKDILSDFVNKKINCEYDDKKKRMNPFILWEESPQRREVEGILFEPSDNYNKKFYNIWKGFDLKKEDYQIGDVRPLLDHIKYIWCNGNENHYNYVINWFAHLIQFPNVKMSSVIVLKSLEGAGKSIVMDLINEIIGDKHSLTISSWDEILGSFNSLAEGKVFMCLDEVTWGGNKKDAGILKNFVSGVKKNINKKGKDQYTIKDFANFVITSNNEWIIPAEKGTRRWFCLELNNKYAGISSEEKKQYFQKVRGVTKEAFAYFLNSIDVSDFNPREFEETPLLQQQVIKGWSSVVNWWFSFMDNGFLDYGECRLNLVSDYLDCPKEFGEIRDDEIYIPKDYLYNCYYNTSNGFKEGNAQFFIKLKDVVEYKEARIQKGSTRIRTIVIKKDIKILQEQFKKLQLFKYDFE